MVFSAISMNIKTKLYLFVAISAVSMAILAYVYYYSSSVRESIVAEKKLHSQVVDYIFHLKSDALLIHSIDKDFLIQKKPELIETHKSFSSHLFDDLDAVKPSIHSADVLHIITAIRGSFAEYEEVFDETAQLILANNEADLMNNIKISVDNLELLLIQSENYDLLHTLIMLNRHMRDFVALKDKRYIDYFSAESELFHSLFNNIDIPDQLKLDIKNELENFTAQFNTIINVINITDLKTRELLSLAGDLSPKIAYLWERNNRHDIEHLAEYSKKDHHVEILFYIALGLIACLNVPLITTISRSIVKSTSGATAILKEIATGKANVKRRLEIHSQDEMGELVSAFNQFMDKLEIHIGEIQSISNQLSEVSLQSQVITDQTNTAVKHEVDQVRLLTSALDDMSGSISSVADNARQCSNRSLDADQSAQKGADIIKGSIASINTMATKIEEASDVVENLATNSESINSVLDVIMNLAEQTNLLALNAAIEAARAGEHGRGFAVVADEVRTLSNHTASATDEIRKTLLSIKSHAGHAADVIKDSREQASNSIERARLSDDSLSTIIEAISDISKMNMEIAMAAEQQSDAAKMINENICSVSDAVNNISSNTQMAISDRGDLSQMATMLQNMTMQFSDTDSAPADDKPNDDAVELF